jgi:hypothetical protein
MYLCVLHCGASSWFSSADVDTNAHKRAHTLAILLTAHRTLLSLVRARATRCHMLSTWIHQTQSETFLAKGAGANGNARCFRVRHIGIVESIAEQPNNLDRSLLFSGNGHDVLSVFFFGAYIRTRILACHHAGPGQRVTLIRPSRSELRTW